MPKHLKKAITIGDVYGRLTIVGTTTDTTPRMMVLCHCSCGTKWIKRDFGAMRRNRLKSCGCLRRVVSKAKATKHGHFNPAGDGRHSAYLRSFHNIRSSVRAGKQRQAKTKHLHALDPKWESFDGFLEDVSHIVLKENELIRRVDATKRWDITNVMIGVSPRLWARRD